MGVLVTNLLLFHFAKTRWLITTNKSANSKNLLRFESLYWFFLFVLQLTIAIDPFYISLIEYYEWTHGWGLRDQQSWKLWGIKTILIFLIHQEIFMATHLPLHTKKTWKWGIVDIRRKISYFKLREKPIKHVRFETDS